MPRVSAVVPPDHRQLPQTLGPTGGSAGVPMAVPWVLRCDPLASFGAHGRRCWRSRASIRRPG